ncbi:MAG: 4-hydroxyphenylacetate decarboxylase small subunit [Bacteroidetes bacterium]|nr:4-hydroxyphenylacetate decarboxylase small subunit [Bacteroidota bacterium]
MENTCKDCIYYLPVDVFKGLCKLKKNTITPDDPECDAFEWLAKCKFCAKFKLESNYLGKCHDDTLVYPDLNATHCTSFEWKNQN